MLIIDSDRFQDVYVSMLLDFLMDEDIHIQIDAIEAISSVLEHIEKDVV